MKTKTLLAKLSKFHARSNSLGHCVGPEEPEFCRELSCLGMVRLPVYPERQPISQEEEERVYGEMQELIKDADLVKWEDGGVGYMAELWDEDEWVIRKTMIVETF